MSQPPLFQDLLRRAQGGDRQAVDELLVLLRPHLEQLARKYADPDRATASTADLVQEAGLRIWQKLDQFKGADDEGQTLAMFGDWVGQIVRHLGLDRQRQRHAQRRKPSKKLLRLDAGAADRTDTDAGRIDPAGSGPTPSANISAAERARLIQAAVERMPQETDRQIVRLCFFDGLSLRQIAEQLQLSYDKVRQRYHHSLKVLERELGGLL
jgi:RNA polymerase sigma factor (sigma-70 family)